MATCRGWQQVKAIKLSRWKRDCLAVRRDGIGLAASGGSQTKANAGILDGNGQHFGRQSLALGLFRPVKGAVEAALGLPALASGDRYFIWQDNLLRSHGHNLRNRWSKTQRESVKLEWRERRHQLSGFHGSWTKQLLLGVDLAGSNNPSSEGEADVLRLPAINFNYTNDYVIASLGFLEGQNAYPAVIKTQQGEALAQRSRMLRAFERHQGLIHAGRLPICLPLTPVTAVARQTVAKFGVPPLFRERLNGGF